MKRIYLFGLSVALTAATSFGQFSIIVEDNFNRSNSSSMGSTQNGLNWSEGGNETGSIVDNELSFNSEGVDGREWGSVNLTSISPYWNSTLTENTAPIVWSFNIQSNAFKLSGVGPTQNALVYVLACNGSNFELASGYAVIFGNPGSTDRLRLVSFNNGLTTGSNLTNIIFGPTIPTNDFLAVKVIYDPVSNNWTLQYEHNSTGFTDPALASYSTAGSAVNTTFTSEPNFVYTGPMYTHSSVSDNTGRFDNLLIIQEWVLPITIQTFEAQPLQNHVNLNWVTGTEINNDFFTIEHSFDGLQFQAVGTIAGAGTSVAAHAYSFRHENLVAGTHYYRLKQTDFDGRWAYSEIITAEIEGSFGEPVIWPNPVVQEMGIMVQQTAAQQGTLSIIDLSGKTVLEQAITTTEGYNQWQVSLQQIPAGTYILRLTGQAGDRSQTHFIKL